MAARPSLPAILFAAAAAVAACGSPNTMHTATPDAAADAPPDAPGDANDVGADSSSDAAVDSSGDAAVDAPVDAAVDAADAGPPGVQRIAGGSFAHTCAALASGAVRCWGVNDLGQLGVERAESRQQCRVPESSPARSLPCETTPRDVPNLTDVAEVAVGNGGTCAVKRDGSVWCWGANDAGQLGQGTSDPQAHAAPVRVTLPPASQVAYGAFHVCALLRDGGVQCWGTNKFGQCGVAPAMSDAQCDPGDGLTAACLRRPRAVAGLAGVRAITAGRNHTCALLGDGSVRCWGLNDSAQLGNGMLEPDTSPRPAPVAVAGLADVAQISAGGSHTCAVLADGSVRCWGWGDLGQLGGAATTSCTVAGSPPFRCAMAPAAVPELTGASQVAAGRWHTCAVLRSGGVRCAGRNDEGQVGLGGPTGATCSSFPDTFPCARTFGEVTTPAARAVTVGNYHSCGLMADGTVRCWGGGYYGQVGDGMTSNRPAPVATSNLP
jgi:alpha-tubulin suppressor-like RCC1 family protein